MVHSAGGALGRFGRARGSTLAVWDPAWGAWPEPTTRAIVSPIVKSGQRAGVTGVLIAGINPRRALDDSYRGFFDLVTGHMATAVANSRAYEEERRRSEALAEIDRAKTTFFSNASHEFRTPLSLMLGPLEDMLGRHPTAARIISERHDLELMHRNGLRLLKLVNTLLDFSRIEAGRIVAVYEPVDLAAYTGGTLQYLPLGNEPSGPAFHHRLPDGPRSGLR